MDNDIRKGFQGICLQNVEGWATLGILDLFSRRLRRRLHNSPFNICSACLADVLVRWGIPPPFDDPSTEWLIESFEASIRKFNRDEDRQNGLRF